MRREAVTLVECLALAPIAVFAGASLLAATQRNAQQDDLARCLANLRAIGQASLTYAAEDSSGFFIPVPALEALPVAPGAFEWGGKAGSGDRTNLSSIATSNWGTSVWRGPAHRPLNRLLYRTPFTDWNPVHGTPQPGPLYVNYINDTRLDLDIYRCPSDTGYAGGGFVYTGGRHRDHTEAPFMQNREGLPSAYDFYGTSYTANVFWSATGSSGTWSSYSAYFRPLTSVPSPAHTVAYQEVPSKNAWLWGDWSDPSCSWTQREQLCLGNFATIAGWHGTNFGTTVTFADGHAGMVIMRGCQRPPPNLGTSNYPAEGCSPETDRYVCYRCVTVRGPGWQLDTFPATPIVTYWSP